MSVVTTALGPKSVRLEFSLNTPLSQIISAMDAFITGTAGWTLYDTPIVGSDSGYGTGKKVYRCLNQDGTYKYSILEFASGIIYFSTCSAWNTSTHTGTNVVDLNGTYNVYLQLNTLSYPGSVVLIGSTKFLSIFTTINGISSLSGTSVYINAGFGVYEIKRDVSYFSSSSTAFCAFSNFDAGSCMNAQIPAYSPLRIPITNFGTSVLGEVSSVMAKTFKSTVSNDTTSASLSGGYGNKQLEVFNDPSKAYVHSISAWGNNNDLIGRIYGLKVLARNSDLVSPNYAYCTVNVDSESFPASNGTPTTHIAFLAGYSSYSTTLLLPA